jgi:hypothetical protein
MPKKQQKEKSLSSFYFRFLQPGDAIIRFLESAVGGVQDHPFCYCLVCRFLLVCFVSQTTNNRLVTRAVGSSAHGWVPALAVGFAAERPGAT